MHSNQLVSIVDIVILWDREIFNDTRKEAVESSPNSAVRFYLKCKANLDEGIGFEPYFDMKNHSDRRCLVELRTSNHRQKIETGRYNQHLNKATLCETERICRCRCDFWTSENVESPCQFSLMLKYPSLKTNVMSLYPVQNTTTSDQPYTSLWSSP